MVSVEVSSEPRAIAQRGVNGDRAAPVKPADGPDALFWFPLQTISGSAQACSMLGIEGTYAHDELPTERERGSRP